MMPKRREMPGTEKRRRAYRFGARAERLAELALRLKGYRILARRFRAPGGEIDIIACRGEVVAFVEVKARPSHQAALEAVTGAQRSRIASACRSFLASNPPNLPPAHRLTLRFDIILVRPGRWPVHIPGAWEPRAS